MRLILASIALLLALLLGGLLLLPRLVEDEAARAMLDRIAVARTGYPLEVEGAIEFSLLPRPTLSFARARLGGERAADAPFAARFDRVDIELAIGPLLRGRLELARMRLVRPTLEIRRPPAEALRALLEREPVTDQRLLLRNLEILDGTLALARPGRGRPVQISGIDALLAGTAGGGFLLEGRGRTLKAPVVFRLEAGVPQRGRPLRLLFRGQLGPGGELAKFRYAGNLLARQGELGGSGEFELVTADPVGFVDALAAALDRLPPELPPLPRPVRVQGRLEKQDAAWVFADLGLEVAGQQLAGEVRLRPGPRPRLEARLEANRLDLELSAAEFDLWRRRLPPPPYDLDARLQLRIGALHWGEAPVRQLRLDARIEPDAGLVLKELVARIPGGGDLRLTGALAAVAGSARWLGEIALSGQSLRETLAWIGLRPPGDLPETALAGYALRGRLRLGPDGASLREGELRVDATSARGSVALLFGERLQLAVAATVDRLVVDDYLGLLPGQWGLADLRRLLGSFDAALDITLERMTLGGLRARATTLRAGLDRGRLTVGELRLADLGGASAGIAGTLALEPLAYDFAADVEIPSPARLARLAGLPGYELLAGLGAMRGQATLRGRGEAGEAELELTGEAARLTITAQGERLASFDTFTARVLLDAASFAAFSRSFGVPPLRPQRVRGPLRVTLDLERVGAGPLLIRALGRITEVALDFDGRWGGDAGGLQGRMLFSPAPGGDLLETVYRLLAPFFGLLPEPPQSWPGAWPRAPLDWSWLDRTRLRLELGFDVPANGLRLEVGEGRLLIEDLDMALAGGRWTGRLELARRGGGVAASASVMLDGARVEELLPLFGVPDGISGDLELGAELRSGGGSIADLVAHLQGEGSLRLREGAIAGIGRDEAGALLVGVVDRLPFRLLGGDLRIARGILESAGSGLALAGERLRGTVGLAADLYAWMIRAGLEVRDPDGVTTEIELFGPLAAPSARLASRVEEEIIPEALASPPDAPAIRTPPPTEGRGPAPPP